MSPYDDLVMNHIKNARNYRALDDANRKSHGTNPLCGDEMDVFLRMDSDCIEDAAFHCTCCGVSMASASMMTEAIKGCSAAQAVAQARSVVAKINADGDASGEAGDEVEQALITTVREFPARARCAALPSITLEAALAGQ